MNLSAAKYRITYEAFSKFSGSLSKVDSVSDLAEVACKNLKYLFNFKLLKISLIDGDRANSFVFSQNKVSIKLDHENLLHYEEELLRSKIPIHRKCDISLFKPFLKGQEIENSTLWGWLFDYNNYKVCIGLISTEESTFVYNDIEILHLLIDSFTTKYRQIQLSLQLKKNNENLIQALTEIEKKNEEIRKINQNQQQIINDRTKAIVDKNAELMELSKLNAHNLREPLSRILGLMEIAEHYSPKQVTGELLPLIDSSAQELDLILKDVVLRSEKKAEQYSAD